MAQSLASQDPIEKLLDGIDLLHLLPIFKEEGVTMECLTTFTHTDLTNIGVTKNENRHKILHAISVIETEGKSK